MTTFHHLADELVLNIVFYLGREPNLGTVCKRWNQLQDVQKSRIQNTLDILYTYRGNSKNPAVHIRALEGLLDVTSKPRRSMWFDQLIAHSNGVSTVCTSMTKYLGNETIQKHGFHVLRVLSYHSIARVQMIDENVLEMAVPEMKKISGQYSKLFPGHLCQENRISGAPTDKSSDTPTKLHEVKHENSNSPTLCSNKDCKCREFSGVCEKQALSSPVRLSTEESLHVDNVLTVIHNLVGDVNDKDGAIMQRFLDNCGFDCICELTETFYRSSEIEHIQVVLYIMQFISYRDENLAVHSRVLTILCAIMTRFLNNETLQRSVFLNLMNLSYNNAHDSEILSVFTFEKILASLNALPMSEEVQFHAFGFFANIATPQNYDELETYKIAQTICEAMGRYDDCIEIQVDGCRFLRKMRSLKKVFHVPGFNLIPLLNKCLRFQHQHPNVERGLEVVKAAVDALGIVLKCPKAQAENLTFIYNRLIIVGKFEDFPLELIQLLASFLPCEEPTC